MDSEFNPELYKGAMGLMQMTASTAVWIAKSMGIADFEADD